MNFILRFYSNIWRINLMISENLIVWKSFLHLMFLNSYHVRKSLACICKSRCHHCSIFLKEIVTIFTSCKNYAFDLSFLILWIKIWFIYHFFKYKNWNIFQHYPNSVKKFHIFILAAFAHYVGERCGIVLNLLSQCLKQCFIKY